MRWCVFMFVSAQQRAARSHAPPAAALLSDPPTHTQTLAHSDGQLGFDFTAVILAHLVNLDKKLATSW